MYFTANDEVNGREVWIVTSSSALPSAVSNSIVTLKDTLHTFSASDFNFIDPDAGDVLESVRIEATPTVGTLFIDVDDDNIIDAGEVVADGTDVPTAMINAGQLKFKPLADEYGIPYDSFEFRVSDGLNLSVNSYTMTVNVEPTNDAWVFDGTSAADSFNVRRNGAIIEVRNGSSLIYSVPLSSIQPYGMIVNGGAGNDVLTMDYATGGYFPLDVTFNGESQTSTLGDKLVIVGGNFSAVTSTFTSANDGSILLDTESGISTILYTGLEPIDITGTTVADLVFNLPAIGSVQTILEDDGTIGNGVSRLRSSPVAFEQTDFSNPSGALTINRGSSTDTLQLAGLASTDFNASLNVGSSSSRFASTTFSGPITLASDKTISSFANSIYVAGAITTNNGAISLDATGDITITQPVITNGGVQTFTADSDGDGSGTFSLSFRIAELVDPNPAAGNRFGSSIEILTSGNVVVTSPYDDAGGTDAGAVYLFNGLTGNLISTLRGSSSNDRVGIGGVTVLANGNFVVSSIYWNNGAVAYAEAVTWVSGVTGISGMVSASNSLVGSNANDQVGLGYVTELSNGNYVMQNPYWNNGGVSDSGAGAVTWGSGMAGVSGVVSASNSLIGTNADDQVGNGDILVLTNGNYVVTTWSWDNYAGAFTWGSGTTGVSGEVSSLNSVIGSSPAAFSGMRVRARAGLDTLIASFPNDGSGRVVVGSASMGFGSVEGSLDAGAGAINVGAADMNLQGTVQSTSSVTISSQKNNRPIDLGSNATGAIGLTDAELDLISAGLLQIGDANSGTIAISADLSQAGKNVRLMTGAGITGTGAFTNGSATPTSITVDQAGDSNYSGLLGGPIAGTANDKNISMIKAGVGALTLSGANTYTGVTQVNSGRLLVNGSLANGPAIDDVIVALGAMLGGNGTIAGSVRIQNGGNLSPGSDVGILHTGGASLNAGAMLNVDINGDTVGTQYDQLDVTGSVTLSSAILNVNLGYTPAHGTAFKIIENDGADLVTGEFSNTTTHPTTLAKSVSGTKFDIAYGNDVVLTYDTDADEGDDLRVNTNSVGYGDRASFTFTVEGLDNDATAVVTFSDGTPGHDTVVNLTSNGTHTADLSAMDHATIVATITAADNVNNVAAGIGDSFAFAQPAMVTAFFESPNVFENETAVLFGDILYVAANTDYVLVVDWGDPNSPAPSTFMLPNALGLSIGVPIASTTDDNLGLSITWVDEPSGIISYQVWHQYLDDGSSIDGNGTQSDISSITVSITNSAGTNSTGTDLVVQNREPFLFANLSNGWMYEGDSTTIFGEFSDLGTSDRHNLSIYWNDLYNPVQWEFAIAPASELTIGQVISSDADEGSLTITWIDSFSGSVGFETSSHQYVDDDNSASSDIYLTLSDDDGASFQSLLNANVTNVDPQISFYGFEQPLLENTPLTIYGSFADVGLQDQHNMIIVWGSSLTGYSEFPVLPFHSLFAGQTITSNDNVGVMTILALDPFEGRVDFSVQANPYLDDGYTGGEVEPIWIRFHITDDDGGYATTDHYDNLYNVAPKFDALDVVIPLTENNVVTLTGQLSDIGIQDEHALQINWLDPNASNGGVSDFQLPNTNSLNVGQSYYSNSYDSTLTITSVDHSTGAVGFDVSYQYPLDMIWLGGTSHQVAVTLLDDDGGIASPSKLPKIVAPATSVTAPVLTVQVSDGSLIDTATVTVTLNLSPQAMAPMAAAKVTIFKLTENNIVGATAATLAGSPAYTGQLFANWSISDSPDGPASSNFYVKSSTATSAVIGAHSKLSFEDQNSYTIYVTVSDSLDETKMVTTPVTINLTDANDAPQLSLTDGVAGLPTSTSGTPIALVSKYTINEYSTVTAGGTPIDGDVLFTLNAHDDDQPSSSLLYALTGTGVTNPSTGIYVDKSGGLQFDAATGQVSVLDATKLDYEKFKAGIPLAFTVIDNGLPGSLPGATPKVLTSRATVTILLNDLNDAPTFKTPTLTVVKAENNRANVAVVTLSATDGDALDNVTQPLTYSLVSAVNGDGMDATEMFTITSTTNATTEVVTYAVTVVPANQYDFESTANETFILTVRATEDGEGGLSTADSILGDQVITLNITDVNEAPSAVFIPVSGSPSVGTTGSVTVNLPDMSVGTIIGSLSITDPDVMAALATFGSDTIVVTVLDGSSTTTPAFTYVPHADPTTGGSLQVNNLTTLQSKIGKPFSVRFTIKDKNGLAGALSFTLTLTINVTDELTPT